MKNKLASFPYLYLSKSEILIFLLFPVLDITRLARLDKIKELYMLILLSFYELMYFMSALVSEFSKVNLKIKNTLLAKKNVNYLVFIYIICAMDIT